MLEILFGSKTRTDILCWLYTHPDEAFYVRQLEKILSLDSANISRELKSLLKMELVSLSQMGNQKHYFVNRKNPVFRELQSIIFKTDGLLNVIKDHLSDVSSDISIAFVYGSVANGNFGSSSDIDLLIIGSVTLKRIIGLLAEIEKKLSREINASVFSKDEFRRKVSDKGFLWRVCQGEKLFLIGSEDDIRKLAGEWLD